MKNIYRDYNIAYKLVPDLDYAVNNIVANQEDFGSFMLTASKFFSSKFEALKGVFGLSSKVTTTELSKGTKKILSDLNKADNIVNKVSNAEGSKYMAVSKILIPYIPGINVDFYTLVTGIKPYAIKINEEIIPILEELDTYFSKLVGDEEFRTSLTPNKDLLDRIKKFQGELNDYLVDVINGQVLTDHREFKDILPNFTSFKICHNTLKDIIGIRDFEKLATIQDISTRIGTRATNFYNMVNKGSVAVSKTRLNEIKDMLPLGAKLVTDAVAIARLVDASLRIQRVLIDKLSGLA